MRNVPLSLGAHAAVQHGGRREAVHHGQERPWRAFFARRGEGRLQAHDLVDAHAEAEDVRREGAPLALRAEALRRHVLGRALDAGLPPAEASARSATAAAVLGGRLGELRRVDEELEVREAADEVRPDEQVPRLDVAQDCALAVQEGDGGHEVRGEAEAQLDRQRPQEPVRGLARAVQHLLQRPEEEEGQHDAAEALLPAHADQLHRVRARGGLAQPAHLRLEASEVAGVARAVLLDDHVRRRHRIVRGRAALREARAEHVRARRVVEVDLRGSEGAARDVGHGQGARGGVHGEAAGGRSGERPANARGSRAGAPRASPAILRAPLLREAPSRARLRSDDAGSEGSRRRATVTG